MRGSADADALYKCIKFGFALFRRATWFALFRTAGLVVVVFVLIESAATVSERAERGGLGLFLFYVGHP